MGSIIRSIFPIRSSKEDDDEYNVEYSFAIEYTGPPVSYDIPRAVPVDVVSIPLASVVSVSSSGDLSLPIIHPVVKRDPKLVLSEINESRLGSDLIGADAHSPSSPEGDRSSISLGFSDSHENSQEFSMSSDGDRLDNYCHEIVELYDASEENRPHEVFSSYDNRTQIVTFNEPESDAMVQEESSFDDPGMVIQERPHASSHVKKGLCHRCLKGNWFTFKEFCIVCDAKYCSNCVLRVMGSMPEGRKCITCIGYPIDESKREHLGKCSKVLKQLLSDFQVKQIMKFEESCHINQLPYWLLTVNGKQLSLEEAVQLRTCAYPPKSLRPGSYWYDKLSGFWGKEGHKPCQIISPQLSVGAPIKENASNGTTKVKINNRVITKVELLMLKFAGINCEGSPSFWVSHDGSYQEEGQNQVNAKIWEMSGIEAICALLSLPVPSKSFISYAEDMVNNGGKLGQENIDTKSLTKLLLVGQDQSGTSAIYKQAKILYNVPFSEDERQKAKSLIQSNLYLYISILLEGVKQFEEEYSMQIRRKLMDQPSTSAAGGLAENIETNIYSLSAKLKYFSDWLLQIVASGNLELVFPATTREYSPVVEELWNNKAFQATYARRTELHALPIVADYFLPQAVEISRPTYEPSDVDILYADGISSSNGLTSMEFSVPSLLPDIFMEATEQTNLLQRYQLIRVNSSSLGDNCKWLTMFEDIDLILYCVDLTSYNEFYTDNNLIVKNKMLESKNIFENIITHPRFKDKAFLLILNKFDLLEKKIKTDPLSQCEWFHDFNPFVTSQAFSSDVSSRNKATLMAQYGFQYIGAKFKRMFSELTGRKLYVSPVTGLEVDSVRAALRYGKEVLRWVDEENKPKSSTNEWSSESIETNS
ncbi:extra-large guanine nucleotide-binding protein 1-like [Cynara cardunculus var. scolymus]|uniref:extra-large guanine nucleotide-binding protein 1-like n=1 Tax=Cynara cardunculus var. scolymus TaxID=59895 RepID=UPI000D62D28F|nr:extra-large guanine nucleotide-binding protein 1-like [Cynara cardunculus var. scolymus]